MAKQSKPTQNPEPTATGQPAAAQAADAQQPKAAGKIKGILPYIIYSAGGIVIVTLIAFGTLFFLKGKNSSSDAAAANTQGQGSAEADSVALSADIEDSLLALTDLGFAADTGDEIDKLIKNIEAMDVKDDYSLAADSEADSAKEISWLKLAKDSLAKQRADLDARQKQIDEREKQVSQKLLRLEQASNDRITNLAKLYDGMDASAVAKLMESLEDSIVVTIIPKMKQKNASQVLQMMPPQRAAKLSREIITLAGD
jgi:flagellar motility protein MotE (MotC chaperone)